MSEKNRIENVMLHYEMTSSQFATEIGIQSSTLSHILNDRNNPSLDVLKKILSRFTEISSDWLVLGQGSMLRQERHSKVPTLFDTIDENSSTTGNYSGSDRSKSMSDTSSIQNEVLKNTEQAVKPSTSPQSSTVEVKAEMATDPSAIKQESQSTVQTESSHSITPNQEPSYIKLNPGRKVTKVILYFTDNTFQEFESK